ncbi:MAG: carbohydrate kinase family protein [Phycisphaerae bacterium]|nr:carbohydrate kinase family protein [Phycisphaerae bacterium]
MEKKFDAVVAGHLCLDITPGLGHVTIDRAEDFFVPGKLINSEAATLSTGGAVSNTGLALVKLGLSTALMGKVGDDAFGGVVKKFLLDSWGVSEGLIVSKGLDTSYTIVLTPHGYDRMFIHCPAANDTFCADDINYDQVADARLFHFGYPPLMQRMYENGGSELVEVYRRVHELGVTTSLDMALPDPESPGGQVDWEQTISQLTGHLDIFLPSAEEILYMLDRAKYTEYRKARCEMTDLMTGDDMHAISDKLLGYGVKIIAIKCGDRGFYVRTAGADQLAKMGSAKPTDLDTWADREIWHSTFRINVTPNTAGSGDCSIAGFLAGILRNFPLEAAVKSGVGAGACNVCAPDTLSGLKPWDEMQSNIAAGWETNPLEVTGDGWVQDGEIWRGPADIF